METNRIGVYPYSAEFEPFLRHLSLLDRSFQISALISPSGWGLAGQTHTADTGLKWTVIPDFEPVINDIDTIFIPSFSVEDKVEALIIKKVEAVVPSVKKIICAAKLSKENAENLKKACASSGCIYEDLNRLTSPDEYGLYRPTEKNPSIDSIDVPIVAIAGLWEEMDKFEASLALRKKFIQNGYKVTQIGSRNCCELYGFHSFPGFMLDYGVVDAEKVVYFNRLVKKMVKTEKPDVVILTIPGAIQNLSAKLTKGFGILPHIVFQAVMADFLLFCTMYDESSIKFLQEISTMCKYKFDCEVDCYHMSNMLFNLAQSKERGRVIINRVKRSDVSHALETGFNNSPIPILNILEQPSQGKLFGMVIDKLSGKDHQVT